MDFEWERKGPPNPDSPWFKHVSHDGWNSVCTSPLCFALIFPNTHSVPAKSTSIFGTPTKPPDIPMRSTTAPVPPTMSLFQPPSSTPQSPRGTPFSSFREPSELGNMKAASGTPNAAEILQSPQRLHPDTSDATPSLHGLRLTDNAREKILSTTTERVSGRGELRRGKFTEAISKRVTKRKQQKSVDHWGGAPLSRRSWPRSDSTDDGDTSDEHHEKPRPVSSPKPKAAILNQSRWDHYFPILLSSYLQLFFNIFIVMVVLYLTTSFLLTIRADVNTKVKQYSIKRQLEIDECSQKFMVNRCNGGYRAPALEELCSRWEECMSQDPDEVGRARVSAQTFAEILNSLIDPISFKTMVSPLPLQEFFRKHYLLHG